MKAEASVQTALAEEFGQLFAETRLQVGYKLDGQPAYKYFDAVSQDKNIVAMVKDYSAENVEGNQTRHARVMRDLYYLSLLKARRRYLYLSKDFYQWFNQQKDVSIASGVEVRTIPL